MEIYYTIPDIQKCLLELKSEGLSLGFVPTMGALHEGHLSLIRRACEENDKVVCSIFINPIQFNNKEDLENYPKTLESDINLLQENDCDILFLPDNDEMYPKPDTTTFDFGHLDKILEGKFRPGHFNGAAIVVKKLFEIIEPHKAYFGEKDYQQLVIIKAMVKKFSIPVEIIPCQTVREKDGLALSSRNLRLNESEKSIAPEIHKILSEAKSKASKSNPENIRQWVISKVEMHPGLKLEYFEIVDPHTLITVDTPLKGQKYIAKIAVFLGKIRLIDNIEIFF